MRSGKATPKARISNRDDARLAEPRGAQAKYAKRWVIGVVDDKGKGRQNSYRAVASLPRSPTHPVSPSSLFLAVPDGASAVKWFLRILGLGAVRFGGYPGR